MIHDHRTRPRTLLVLAATVVATSSRFGLGVAGLQQPSSQPQRSSPAASLLTNTRWRVSMDVGQEPGTWMPRRYPGWAASGARLGLDVVVRFTDRRRHDRFRDHEIFVGPREDTFELEVVPSFPDGASCRFVSERGEERVSFGAVGGWCVQRPTADVRNAGGGSVRPEGLLRFWLDCESGAKRRDVEVRPATRVFGTTGVWDDPASARTADEEYRAVLTNLNDLVDETRELRARRESGELGVIENLRAFQRLVSASREFDLLKSKKDRFEMELPPLGSPTAANGVQIAPSGSLVIKGNETPDWMPGSEYLILGTFTVAAQDS